ncbi:MAG: hypothetical protein ACI8W8_004565, partial [Rhodothermales bacterium]
MKMLTLLLFSLVASAPFCCAADDRLNLLSAAEQEAGWQSLFDGRTLNGWRGYRKQAFADSWAVADNAVFCTGSGNTHLITEQVYSDFELSIDWKIAKGGNSGVLLRCDESDPYPAGCAIELQVIDDSEGWKSVHNYGLGPGNSAGAVYGFYP